MTIAVDLNDVLRDYTNNFGQYYKRDVNKDIDLESLEIKTNHLDEVFEFDSRKEYEQFVYEDYPWELFGKCPACDKGLGPAFINWTTKTIPNIDVDEPIDVILVSTFEYGLTIPATYWFISRFGARTREVYLPMDSSTIWDRCDVLITANPKLLKEKPEGKTTVKISVDYNAGIDADFTYDNMLEFLNTNGSTEKLIQRK